MFTSFDDTEKTSRSDYEFHNKRFLFGSICCFSFFLICTAMIIIIIILNAIQLTPPKQCNFNNLNSFLNINNNLNNNNSSFYYLKKNIFDLTSDIYQINHADNMNQTISFNTIINNQQQPNLLFAKMKARSFSMPLTIDLMNEQKIGNSYLVDSPISIGHQSTIYLCDSSSSSFNNNVNNKVVLGKIEQETYSPVFKKFTVKNFNNKIIAMVEERHVITPKSFIIYSYNEVNDGLGKEIGRLEQRPDGWHEEWLLQFESEIDQNTIDMRIFLFLMGLLAYA
ncbi:hypothetical protein ABK040_006371 [Willaertia magna]